MLRILRDPIWQFVGVAVAIVALFAMIALARPTLVQRWWLPGVLIILALVALVAVLLLRGPLSRAGAQVVAAANRAVRTAKTEGARLRAYHSGQLEELRSELETERHRYGSEKAKVDKLTLALATLSDGVLRLFDRRVERPDELEWEGALTASEWAMKRAEVALSHHVTKIVYYDPDYPGSWVKEENASQARDYFVKRFFIEKNAQALAGWMRSVRETGLASRSLVVFAQDIVPDTVAEVRNQTCLLRKYLDAGGRVVWRGDIPFWYQGKAGQARDDWNESDPLECGPWKILRVCYYNYRFKWKSPKSGEGLMWDGGLSLETTPAGRDIGLGYPARRIIMRLAPCEDVGLTYSVIPQRDFSVVDAAVHGSAGDFALCWKKNFNERYSHSGFMQYVPGNFVWREVNDDFFRFAVSAWPLLFED